MAAVATQSLPARPRPPSSSSSSPRPSSRLRSSPPSSAPPVARAPLVWRKRIPLSFAQPQFIATAYISSTGRVISRKRDDKLAAQTADKRRATSAARSRIRDRSKAHTAAKKDSAPRQQRVSDDRWTDREGWKTVEEDEEGEEKIEQDDSAIKRQPSAVTAMLLAYPRPLPLPPPQSFSPLMSPSLLSLTMRYWQTFHPPLTAGCWLPRPAYLHLRLLTLRSALLSASHGHLSLRSLALLSHLDWWEDSAEQVDEDEYDEREREAAANSMRLPVFHRALLTWAMMTLGVNERTVQVEQLEHCIQTLYQQATVELAEAEESKETDSSSESSVTRRYLPLSADDDFMLREVADDARSQWKRATAEHNKRKHKADNDDEQTRTPTPTLTTASIVQRIEERKEALALQQSMPPLFAGAVSVIVRRYPSGSEIRQQARMSADRPNRAVNSRERQLSASASLSSSPLSAYSRGAAFEPLNLSAPQSLSPVKLIRHRNSSPSLSPTPSRPSAVTSKGGRSQLSQSPPPSLSLYAQPQLSPSALSLTPTARGDMSTSFAALSLHISPIARQTGNAKPK